MIMSIGRNKHKIILDLCGGTGAWSKPYAEAGYDVRVITLPMFDVIRYAPPKNVYGILAAPPCTQFSFARTKAKMPRDLRKGMKVVQACLNIIWECRASNFENNCAAPFWALENPKGYLRHFLGLPVLEFDPCDFGDPYIKKTNLWGYFKIPKFNRIEIPAADKIKFAIRQGALEAVEMRNLFNPDGYEHPPDMPEIRTIRRAITPPNFAREFFKANQ
jgi:hypothetical protein